MQLSPLDPKPTTRPLVAWPFAAAAAIIPITAVHVAYGVSVAYGRVEGCVPYVEGCTSISRACRSEPAVHLLRACVLPMAPVMAAVWWLAGRWLERLEGRRTRANHWIVGLGVIGALFMVLYATYLGTEGPFYRLMRRYGVYVFFGFTAIAELVLTLRLGRLARMGQAAVSAGQLRAMRAASAAMILLGLANIPASNIYDLDALENVIEWWFALLMIGWFGFLARAWRRDALRIDVDE